MRYSGRLTILLTGLLFGLAVEAGQMIKSGENRISVVELYTSEGCSSCPPADSFLSRLGQSQQGAEILPLAIHVDYWDYIGWKDPYARAEYTERQRRVAIANRQSSIYTPEFVVDGREARGSRNIVDQVNATRNSPAEADMTLSYSVEEEGVLNVSLSVDGIHYQGPETPELYLAIYENGLSNEIDAGENRGRTLSHDHVVRYLSSARLAIPGQAQDFELPIDPQWQRSSLGIAAVVRLRESGRTLQAVKGGLAAPGS